jgi:hypothetical protein
MLESGQLAEGMQPVIPNTTLLILDYRTTKRLINISAIYPQGIVLLTDGCGGKSSSAGAEGRSEVADDPGAVRSADTTTGRLIHTSPLSDLACIKHHAGLSLPVVDKKGDLLLRTVYR